MQAPNVHHITYYFPTAGLTPDLVERHAREARASLAAHFAIDLEAVQVKHGPKLEHDVTVMVGASGKSQDMACKVAAMRVLMPLFRALTYVRPAPRVLVDKFADVPGPVVLLRLVKPKEVLNGKPTA